MNNKGQSLALFIILIPLIIILGVYAVDVGYMKYNQNKLDSINKQALEYALDNIDNLDKEKVRSIITLNDDEITVKEIKEIENGLEITVEKSFKGLFGYFIDKNAYNAKSHYKGTIIDNKKSIERGN